MENPNPSKTTAGYVITLVGSAIKQNHTPAPTVKRAAMMKDHWKNIKQDSQVKPKIQSYNLSWANAILAIPT